ncbi:DUF4870 domain-containing protein [Leifsonia sp. ZF2019]|uniref:DUF4870 domain-containing protein n=1 Tax=Leifsonia sp. ZF2019 TaxID=2781978 RepID=UPI001CBAA470|nr:DUF4870 domain-containing protein [Leifsonia sp. ZF2019]UAJ77728.1 DUF4870 domain-containing protein [Leifsonia sp. ZF2019]
MSDPTQPQNPEGGVPPQQPPVPPQQPAGPPPGVPQQPYGSQQPYGAQPAGAPQQPYAAPGAPLDAAQDKQWASFAHLGGILWFLPSLIIWLVFKDRGQKADVEAKEALNWQITWIIVWVASQIIGIILAFTGVGWLLFGLLIPWALYILNLVFSILGFVKVNSGGSYRYPVNFRFIK